jgi:hypothetical protein
MPEAIHLIYAHDKNPVGDLISPYYLTSEEEAIQVMASVADKVDGQLSLLTLKPGKWDGKYINPI